MGRQLSTNTPRLILDQLGLVIYYGGHKHKNVGPVSYECKWMIHKQSINNSIYTNIAGHHKKESS